MQLLPLNADTHAEQKTRAHIHSYNHNLDWVSQVQSICIHGRFCIGSTTYSVLSNCWTWLSILTLRRPWTVLECVYGCIYGRMVLPEGVHNTKVQCFDAQIDLCCTSARSMHVLVLWICRATSTAHTYSHTQTMSLKASTELWRFHI